MPGEVVGEHAQEHVRADALGEAMVDRADLEFGAFEGPERALDVLELFVGAHDLTRGQLGVGHARSEHVDPSSVASCSSLLDLCACG